MLLRYRGQASIIWAIELFQSMAGIQDQLNVSISRFLPRRFERISSAGRKFSTSWTVPGARCVALRAGHVKNLLGHRQQGKAGGASSGQGRRFSRKWGVFSGFWLSLRWVTQGSRQSCSIGKGWEPPRRWAAGSRTGQASTSWGQNRSGPAARQRVLVHDREKEIKKWGKRFRGTEKAIKGIETLGTYPKGDSARNEACGVLFAIILRPAHLLCMCRPSRKDEGAATPILGCTRGSHHYDGAKSG